MPETAPVIFGVDFTSRPSRRKPLTCARCRLSEGVLQVDEIARWPGFAPLEAMLRTPGPWVGGFDFPFGQARRFIDTIGWPRAWPAYVAHARSLGRTGFRDALDDYRAGRAPGDKEHRRATDAAAGAISPQKLYGVPVGLMFFEGAPRLLDAGVHIPGLHAGDPARVALETYPALAARRVIGRRPYKHDGVYAADPARRKARHAIIEALRSTDGARFYGLRLCAPDTIADDPSGDTLDAVLCALQAAWAWPLCETLAAAADPREGWIADPGVRAAQGSV